MGGRAGRETVALGQWEPRGLALPPHLPFGYLWKVLLGGGGVFLIMG